MFNVEDTAIPGCFIVHPKIHSDARGKFIKTFHADFFINHGMAANFVESYYSVSRKGVLRGLHLQMPPYDYEKLVYCTHGTILDVALDVRAGSPAYGQHIMLELSADNGTMVYLPKGIAHGFYALADLAMVAYSTTALYAPEHDSGILWNSAAIPWPDSNPIISPRDANLIPLEAFQSPFLFSA